MLYPIHAQYSFSLLYPAPSIHLGYLDLKTLKSMGHWELKSEVKQLINFSQEFLFKMFSHSLSQKSEMCMGSFHFPTGEAETLSNAEIGNTEVTVSWKKWTSLKIPKARLPRAPYYISNALPLGILHISISFIYLQKPTFL